MFIIPGFVITAITFPGVIVHEAAHLFFCKRFHVGVFDVCFFRFGNPAGWVQHEPTENFPATFMITMGPFFINSVLCVLFCSAAFLPVWELKVEDPVGYFFAWLGLSIGMNAFPSTADLGILWRRMPQEAKRGSPLALLSYPVVAILYVLNLARFFWADLIYGVLIGFIGPLAIFKALV